MKIGNYKDLKREEVEYIEIDYRRLCDFYIKYYRNYYNSYYTREISDTAMINNNLYDESYAYSISGLKKAIENKMKKAIETNLSINDLYFTLHNDTDKKEINFKILKVKNTGNKIKPFTFQEYIYYDEEKKDNYSYYDYCYTSSNEHEEQGYWKDSYYFLNYEDILNEGFLPLRKDILDYKINQVLDFIRKELDEVYEDIIIEESQYCEVQSLNDLSNRIAARFLSEKK